MPINAPQLGNPQQVNEWDEGLVPPQVGNDAWAIPILAPKKYKTHLKSTLPPLELNIKAKGQHPFVELKTIEALLVAIADGDVVVFGKDQVALSPCMLYSKQELMFVLQQGCWKDVTRHVRLFRMIQRKHKIHDTLVISLWTGRSVQEMNECCKQLGNCFVGWLSPLEYFTYLEGTTLNV